MSALLKSTEEVLPLHRLVKIERRGQHSVSFRPFSTYKYCNPLLLSEQCRDLADKGVNQQEIDLENVDVFSSAFLSMLMTIHLYLKRNNGHLEISNLSNTGFRALEKLSLDHVFDITSRRVNDVDLTVDESGIPIRPGVYSNIPTISNYANSDQETEDAEITEELLESCHNVKTPLIIEKAAEVELDLPEETDASENDTKPANVTDFENMSMVFKKKKKASIWDHFGM